MPGTALATISTTASISSCLRLAPVRTVKNTDADASWL
ncbi:Uncharacterised protein [Vibrio cholerae]|nr:Uncharacterised protein [Vibrio cholerae]